MQPIPGLLEGGLGSAGAVHGTTRKQNVSAHIAMASDQKPGCGMNPCFPPAIPKVRGTAVGHFIAEALGAQKGKDLVLKA